MALFIFGISMGSLASESSEGSFQLNVKLSDAVINSRSFCEEESQRIVSSLNELIRITEKSSPMKIEFVECENLGWKMPNHVFKVYLRMKGRSCVHGNPALFPLKREYRINNWSFYSKFTSENSKAALDSLGIRFFELKSDLQLLMLPDCTNIDE